MGATWFLIQMNVIWIWQKPPSLKKYFFDSNEIFFDCAMHNAIKVCCTNHEKINPCVFLLQFSLSCALHDFSWKFGFSSAHAILHKSKTFLFTDSNFLSHADQQHAFHDMHCFHNATMSMCCAARNEQAAVVQLRENVTQSLWISTMHFYHLHWSHTCMKHHEFSCMCFIEICMVLRQIISHEDNHDLHQICLFMWRMTHSEAPMNMMNLGHQHS